MRPIGPRQAQVLEMLHAELGGISSPAVAARLGISQHRARDILSALRTKGLAGMTGRRGESCKWSTPERIPALIEQAKQASRQSIREQNRRSYLKRASEKEQSAAEQWLHPIHRRISAHEAPPIRPAVPMSVFLLAA